MTHKVERVLVTGGSGFIGTNLVARLIEDRRAVLNLDVAPPHVRSHHAVWERVDMTNGADVADAISSFRPDAVVHLAARTDFKGKHLNDYSVNVEGTRGVVEAVRATSTINRLIVVSSRMVCRLGYEPKTDTDYCAPNAYGQSKVLAEEIVRSASLSTSWTIVRPTSIWGPWFGTPYREFFDSVLAGRYVHPSGMRIPKAFGYVENCVHQLSVLADNAQLLAGRTAYLADYAPLDVQDFANTIRRAVGKTEVRQVPLQALRVLARMGDIVDRASRLEPPLTSFRLRNLLTPMVYSVNGIEDAVGKLPFTTEVGIARTLDWLAERGDSSTAEVRK
jgi:nucleoside-diphosphate-sugar epimerase